MSGHRRHPREESSRHHAGALARCFYDAPDTLSNVDHCPEDLRLRGGSVSRAN